MQMKKMFVLLLKEGGVERERERDLFVCFGFWLLLWEIRLPERPLSGLTLT